MELPVVFYIAPTASTVLSVGRLLGDSFAIRVPGYFMPNDVPAPEPEDLFGPEAKVILIEFGEPGRHEADFERYWRAALQSGKPIVGIVFRGERIDIPPELRTLPILDVRDALDGGAAVDQTVMAAMNRVTDAVHDAFESTLPPEARQSFARAIETATAQFAASEADRVVLGLSVGAQAYGIARSASARRMMRRARDAVIAGHNRIVELTEGRDGQLRPELADLWDQSLDVVEMTWVRVRQNVLRTIRDEDGLDVERLLQLVAEGWASAAEAKDAQAFDQLRTAFEVALRSATRVLAKRANAGERVGGAFERVARLYGTLQNVAMELQVLGVAAQAWLASPDGWLRSVYAIERAMQVPGMAFPDAARAAVLESASIVRQRLEAEAERLMNAGDEPAARSAMSVVLRLCRALPDQGKLAEALTCATQLGTAEAPADEIRREALLLARAYERHDLTEFLGAVPAALEP